MSILASRRFHAALGALVSAILIGWLAFVVDWGLVWRELQQVNPWLLLPMTAVLILHHGLRALRWRFLLPHGERESVRGLFESLMVGNLATFLLPLRAGEFIRPYLLSRAGTHAFTVAFVSVVIERFFDLAFVLVSFAVLLPFVPAMPEWAFGGAASLFVVALAILLVMALSAVAPERVQRLGERFVQIAPARMHASLKRVLNDVVVGSGVLRAPARLVSVLVLTLVVWTLTFLYYDIGLRLFGVAPSPWVCVTTTVILAFAVAAPSAPGFVGVFQTACVAAFLLFGYSKELALAFALITHLHQYLFMILVGGWILVSRNLRLSDLRVGASRA